MRPHVRYAGEWVPLVGPVRWVPKSVTFTDVGAHDWPVPANARNVVVALHGSAAVDHSGRGDRAAMGLGGRLVFTWQPLPEASPYRDFRVVVGDKANFRTNPTKLECARKTDQLWVSAAVAGNGGEGGGGTVPGAGGHGGGAPTDGAQGIGDGRYPPLSQPGGAATLSGGGPGGARGGGDINLNGSSGVVGQGGTGAGEHGGHGGAGWYGGGGGGQQHAYMTYGCGSGGGGGISKVHAPHWQGTFDPQIIENTTGTEDTPKAVVSWEEEQQ